MNLSSYRKLIVAGIGFTLLLAKQFFGLNVDNANADQIVNLVVTLATLIGVHQTSNTPTP